MKNPKPFPKRHGKEYEWAYSVYPELAKKYPNMWIAFANRRVLSHGRNLARVMRAAHEVIRWQEIPHLFIEKGIHVGECWAEL